MNAGAYGGEMKDVVYSVSHTHRTVISAEQRQRILSLATEQAFTAKTVA